MSNRMEREAEDIYEDENDISPVSGGFSDNSYAHETKSGMRDTIPVKRDDDVEESEMHPPYSNSDEQLEHDENEAIDRSNILRGDRLRHAKPQSSSKYSEGPDEDDLPAEVLNATY